MSNMNIHASYFSISNPLDIIDRWFNPFQLHKTVSLDDKEIDVSWTHRADKALELRDSALVVEMQLYFSCVVKKRIIFHEDYAHNSVIVNEKLRLAFRPVEALSCDPVEFARHYPVKQELTSRSAIQMHPSRLEIDFRHATWQGMFTI